MMTKTRHIFGNRTTIMIGLMIIIGIFAISFASASDFSIDNVKEYNATTKTVVIWDKDIFQNPTTIIGMATLDTPQVNYVIPGKNRLVFEIKANNSYEPRKIIDGLEFTDINTGKPANINLIWRYAVIAYNNITDYVQECKDTGLKDEKNNSNPIINCTEKISGSHLVPYKDWRNFDDKAIYPKGEVYLGGFADVNFGDRIEWIPTLFGQKITEWATWTSSFNVNNDYYYRLAEGTGTTSVEKVSGIKNITFVNSTIWNVTSMNDNAVWYKVINGVAMLNITEGLNTTGANTTINFWYKGNSNTGYKSFIGLGVTAAEGNVPYPNGHINIYFNSNKMGIRCLTEDGIEFTVPMDNTYHMISFEIEKDRGIRYYLDGGYVSNGTKVMANWNGLNATYATQIGSSLMGITALAGVGLDEPSIWSRGLSLSEIADLNNSGLGIFPPLAVSPDALEVTTTLISPANATSLTNISINFTASATILGGNITNMTIYVWNSTSLFNSTANTGLTYANNRTSWLITNLRADNYTWNVQSCAVNITNSLCANATTNNSVEVRITAPNVTFNFQDPSDINSVNVFGKLLNISYNITTIYGLNITSMTFKTNSSLHDYSIIVNGSILYSGWQNSANASVFILQANQSGNYSWKLADNSIYPATYNYNETAMENTAHSLVTLGSTDVMKIQLLNISNTSQFNIFEIMSNSSGVGSANFYYCNDTYITGNPASTSTCSQFGTLAGNSPYNHTHTVNSKHMTIPMAIVNGLVGTVKVTPTSYFVETRASSPWDVYYIAPTSRTDAIQLSTNNGAAFANQTYTVDSHIHQFSGSDQFWYYVCSQNVQSRTNCSDINFDYLNQSGMPPTAPQVFSPVGDYADNILINYTASQSVNQFDILFYNISLLYPNETFLQTIRSNNSNNLSFLWNGAGLNGTYLIRVDVTDNMSSKAFGISQPFTMYSALKTFNPTTYETSTEQFNITLNYNSSLWTSVVGAINYGGTFHTSTKNGFNFTNSIDIPASGAATNNIYWQFNLSNSTDARTIITNISTQTVNLLLFDICNDSRNDKYINISFRNETVLQQPISATIISTWAFWMGSNPANNKTLALSNTTENPSYAFCSNGGNQTLFARPSIQYQNAGSTTRNYNPGILTLTNSTTNITLYLLPTALGQFVTFQVINSARQAVSGADINVTSSLTGGTESKATDSAGSATFFMSPITSYTIVASKTGYIPTTISITPTQTQYTITIGAIEATNITDLYKGISTSVFPRDSQLNNNTVYPFNFTINSTFYLLSSYGFTIGNMTDVFQSVSDTNGVGGTIGVNMTTGKNTTIRMNYFWVINGTYSNGTRLWYVFDESGTQYSILNFANDFRTYLTSGSFFGLDSFGLGLIIFLIIFVFTGIMSYKFGLTSPAAITLIIFCMVAFFDVALGLIPNPVGAVPHFPTIFIGVILIGIFFQEVTR